MTAPDYHPLLDTLRLYAGWLLACLLTIFALGSYQQLRHLPLHLSILDEWMDSPLILQVTFITFLFLLLSSVHRAIGRGVWKGLALTALGFFLLVIFRVNT